MARHLVRTVSSLTVLIALSLVSLSNLQAQTSPWSISSSAGATVPTNGLADLTDVGPSYGAEVGYELLPRLDVQVSATVALLSGQHRKHIEEAEGVEGRMPDVDLWQARLDLEYRLLSWARSRFHLDLRGAGGLVAHRSDGTVVVGFIPSDPARPRPIPRRASMDPVEDEYPTAALGLTGLYQVSPGVAFFLDGGWHLLFADEAETETYTEACWQTRTLTTMCLPTGLEPFGTVSTVSLGLGARFRF